MTTPNLNLTELANQQNQYLNANATFAIIDALLAGAVPSAAMLFLREGDPRHLRIAVLCQFDR